MAPPARPPARSPRRPWAARPGAALAVLLGVLALAYLPLLFGGVIFFRDLAHYAYPMRRFVADAIARGDSPFWNPLQGLGFSVAANPQYGVWYPPHLLFQLGAGPRAVTWFWLAHTAWGGWGTARLARTFGASPAGALVAGVAWSLSGFVTGEWSAGLRLPAAAWIPWIAVASVALARAAANRRGAAARRGALLRRVAALAAVVAASALLGELFLTMMGLGLGLALAAVALLVEDRTTDGGVHRREVPSALARAGAALAAALALGLSIAAVTIVPARAALGGSARAGGVARAVAERCSLHPWRLLEMAAPGAFGTPYATYPAAEPIATDCLDGHPLVVSVYFGAATLALAAAAFGRRRRAATALGALAVATLAVALGRHLPVHGALRALVPPLAYMRHPEKYLAMTAPLVAVLAALGATRVLDAAPLPWRRTLALAVGIALVGGVASALARPALAPFLRAGALHGALAAAAVLAAQGLAARRARLAAPLLLAVVAGDLAAAAWPLQEIGPDPLSRQRPPAIAEAVLGDRAPTDGPAPPRLFRAATVEDEVARRVPVRSFPEAELRWMATLVPNVGNTFGVADPVGYDPLIPAAIGELWAAAPARTAALMRIFRVGHALLPASQRVPPTLDDLGERVPGARLVREQEALPRVTLANAAEVVPDGDVPRRIWSRDVVEGRLALLAPGPDARALAGALDPPDACRVDVFENARVEAVCASPVPAVAVFVEQWAPGWTAEIDGHAAPLLRANLVMRAVALPAGAHHITLRFRPPGLGLGEGVSLVAIAVLAALLGASVVLARRAARAGDQAGDATSEA